MSRMGEYYQEMNRLLNEPEIDMYPRTNYEMTEEDLETLLEAMKPVPMIMVGGYVPSSQQENANRAWAALGEKMGFESATVEPIPNKGSRFFSAVPSETESQREERIFKEAVEKREAELSELGTKIDELEERRKALLMEGKL